MADLRRHREHLARAVHTYATAYEAIEAAHLAIAQSQELLTEIDIILAKGGGVLIGEYYGKD